MVWTVAYDPNTTTTHKNPVYDNPDWAKDFDVIVHDECSSDVKDLAVIERHPQAAPRRSAGRGAALRHALLSQRGLAQRGHALVRVHRPANHRPRGAVADRHSIRRPAKSRSPQGLEDWTTIKEELYNNITGKLLDTAQALARGTQTVRSRGQADFGRLYRRLDQHLPRQDEGLRHDARSQQRDRRPTPRYLDLVTRGLLWSVDKLDDAHLKPPKQALIDPRPGARR